VDDPFCLFIIFASMLTFAMPAVAQSTFALFAAALALATRIAPANDTDRSETSIHRRALG
jgi:hypothetical protein